MARSIEVVGKLFPTAAEFLTYLESLQFGVWRPRYVTMHHTAAPSLAQWKAWQTRKPPITDGQWLRNLGVYYATERGWSVGPHVFTTPTPHIGILTPLTKRGIHAASFNGLSWGLEAIGYFDSEKFEGPIKEITIGALAAMHVALGIQPAPYQRGVRGLHFHRDDPLTSKTCPGLPIKKENIVPEIEKKMLELTGGAHASDPEEIPTPITPTSRTGVIATSAADPTLNVRADASARSPVVNTLKLGDKVKVTGERMNGTTKWFSVGDLNGDGNADWVAAQFVKLD